MITYDELEKYIDDFELDETVSDRELAKQWIRFCGEGKILTITAEDGLPFHMKRFVNTAVTSYTVPSHIIDGNTFIIMHSKFACSEEEMKELEEEEYYECKSVGHFMQDLSDINFSREFQCIIED